MIVRLRAGWARRVYSVSAIGFEQNLYRNDAANCAANGSGVALNENCSLPVAHKSSTFEERPIYILGGGGHAAVVEATLEMLEIRCVGCISKQPAGRRVSAPWIGDDEALARLDPSSTYLANGIGSIASLNLRRLMFERSKAIGFTFISIVHPSAIVDSTVELCEGAQILAGAIVQLGTSIGPNSIVNSGAIVEHHSRVGAHCHIASGVRLSGDVEVSENAHVGIGATLIQGLKIGQNAIVGAGSVVISDVRPWSCVAGVPAKVISRT